jgi:hypothetical protein
MLEKYFRYNLLDTKIAVELGAHEQPTTFHNYVTNFVTDAEVPLRDYLNIIRNFVMYNLRNAFFDPVTCLRQQFSEIKITDV